MFNNKKDPLVDAVKSIMEASAREREIERKLNESLGITSKKALPHELHKEYDTVLKESIAGSQINEVSEKLLKRAKQKAKDKAMVAWELNDRKAEDKNEKRAEKFSKAIAKKQKMKEEKELSPKQEKLAAKAGNPYKIGADDLEALRKDKTLDEAKATEAQKEKVAKVMHKWKQGEEHIGKSDKTVPVTKKGQKQAVAIALSQAGLSKKMDESVEAIHEEIRTAIMEKLNHIYENEGVDAANAYFETLSEEERGILGEQASDLRNMALGRAAERTIETGRSWNPLRWNQPNYGSDERSSIAPKPPRPASVGRQSALGDFNKGPASVTSFSGGPESKNNAPVSRTDTPLRSGGIGNPNTVLREPTKSPTPANVGEPSKDLETGVTSTPAAPKPTPKPTAPTATAPKPAATATSTDDGGSFSGQPTWAKQAFSGGGGEGGYSGGDSPARPAPTPRPTPTRQSSFQRATRGDFSGITGGGGA